MSTLQIRFHPLAAAELTTLATSDDEQKVIAAAQISNLLSLIETHAAIRERLYATFETVGVVDNGTYREVDIKMIQSLKDVADDSKWHKDAIRRIRDITNKPADDYRIFFVLRPPKAGCFSFQVLGIFERNDAYKAAQLNELKKRY